MCPKTKHYVTKGGITETIKTVRGIPRAFVSAGPAVEVIPVGICAPAGATVLQEQRGRCPGTVTFIAAGPAVVEVVTVAADGNA